MDRSIYGFILRYSRRQQIFIVALTLVSFPFLYYSLELPKQIVNDAIGGTDFPKSFFGISLEQVPYLFALSGLFLVLVFVNGGFKYAVNVYKGQTGERMLRRLRYELYARVLRFPAPHFKKMSQGEIIPMITGEVEPLGGFIGDSFVLPIFQGGTLLVYIGFIFVQDPVLGAAAISLYPIQGYIIPRLQRRVNELGKQRVRTMRHLSDRIGELVSGIQEIHAYDTSNYHLADFAHRLGNIFDIRFEIYRRKFFIKFLNNFINQLTPFFFYAIGGYLVIKGRLDLGALVAVLAAYKDLAAPWKELLTYYQLREDSRIKYEQVIEQFQPAGMLDVDQLDGDETLDPLPDSLVFSNVVYAEDDAPPMVDGVSATLPLDRHIAVLGDGDSGRDSFMMLAARLIRPTAGRIRLGGADYADLPEAVTGRAIGYVGPRSYLFTDTLGANLLYGLKHRPMAEPAYDEKRKAWRQNRIREAMSSGNIVYDIDADWVDYAAAGAESPEEMLPRVLAALAAVDLDQDVYRMGLNGTIEPQRNRELADKILEARKTVRARLTEDPEARELVEPFEADRYNTSATVAENLLFGTAVGPTFAHENLADHPYVRKVLADTGLTEDFLQMGAQVAETMIELFADLPPGHEFFEQFSFIGSEDLPDFQPLVTKVGREGVDGLKPEEKSRLMALPFKLIASRHRLGLLEEDMQQRLVEARRQFADGLPPSLRPCVEFFDPDSYNSAASIQDNILFGRIRYGRTGTADSIRAVVRVVMGELDLRNAIIAVGLDHSVGVGGARMTAIQRQKTALARAILKRSAVLILNEATAPLDGGSQARIHSRLREWADGRGLIWAPHRPSLARDFDEVIVLKAGRIAERGRFEELDREGSVLRELLEAE